MAKGSSESLTFEIAPEQLELVGIVDFEVSWGVAIIELVNDVVRDVDIAVVKRSCNGHFVARDVVRATVTSLVIKSLVFF